MTENQTNSPEQVETVEVEDLNQFVTLLNRWHDTKVRLLKHMEQIPEGTVIEVDGKDEEFTGDLRRGFMLGVTVSLSELGTLPFAAEVDEEQPAANDHV